MFNNMIKKSVIKSQHCQRNWDLDKNVPAEDIEVMRIAVTQCPSKQNYSYYKPYIITNRDIIEAIYDQTDGFDINDEGDTVKNPQVKANVLVAFVLDDDYMNGTTYREANVAEARKLGYEMDEQKRQRLLSTGIAAGYLNLSSTLMGYSTGCCTCFNEANVRKILSADKEVMLLMGVGWADKTRSRLEMHDDRSFVFPSCTKHLDAVMVT